MSGKKHDFLLYGRKRQTIPSNDPYSPDQVQKLLRQVEAVIGREITRTVGQLKGEEAVRGQRGTGLAVC